MWILLKILLISRCWCYTFYWIPDYIKSCACMEVCRQVVLTLDVSFLMENYYDSAIQQVITHILNRIRLMCLGALCDTLIIIIIIINIFWLWVVIWQNILHFYLFCICSFPSLYCVSSLSWSVYLAVLFPIDNFFNILISEALQLSHFVVCVLHIFYTLYKISFLKMLSGACFYTGTTDVTAMWD
jgi:hypothetical protein